MDLFRIQIDFPWVDSSSFTIIDSKFRLEVYGLLGGWDCVRIPVGVMMFVLNIVLVSVGSNCVTGGSPSRESYKISYSLVVSEFLIVTTYKTTSQANAEYHSRYLHRPDDLRSHQSLCLLSLLLGRNDIIWLLIAWTFLSALSYWKCIQIA